MRRLFAPSMCITPIHDGLVHDTPVRDSLVHDTLVRDRDDRRIGLPVIRLVTRHD